MNGVVNIELKAAGDAAKKIAELTQAMLQAGAAQKSLGGAGRGPGGASGGGSGGAMLRGAKGLESLASGGGMNMLRGSGAAGGVAVAGYVALGMAADRSAKALEILNNSYTTQAQKSRALAEEFIPLADKFFRLGDAISGVSDKMERLKLEGAIKSEQQQVREDFNRRIRAAQFEQAGAANQAYAAGSMGYGSRKVFDRGTYAGQIQADNYEQRRAAELDVIRAGRSNMGVALTNEANVAKAEERARKAAYDLGTAKNKSATETGRENSGWFGGSTRNKVGIEGAEANLQRALTENTNAQKQYEEEINRQKTARLDLIRSEQELNAAIIKQKQTELNILSQQEQRMTSAARTVGGMGAGDRAFGTAALKTILERKSTDGLSAEFIGAARSIAPQAVDKITERTGQGQINGQIRDQLGPEFFKEAFPDFNKNTIEGTRKQIDALRADVEVNLNFNEVEVAKKIADALKPIVDALISIRDIEVKKIDDKLTSGRRREANSNGK